MQDLNSEQTAVEQTDGAAQPAPEVKDDAQGVGDGFEADLAEFDQGTKEASKTEQQKPADTKPQPMADDEIARISTRVRLQMEAERDEEQLYDDVLGDMKGKIDRKFAKGFVAEAVKEDERLLKVFVNRRDNPDLYKRMVGKLHGEFTKPFRAQPDADATADRVAVAHAVRGHQGQAPESKAPDFSRMTDNEYREAVRKQYGFNPI